MRIDGLEVDFDEKFPKLSRFLQKETFETTLKLKEVQAYCADKKNQVKARRQLLYRFMHDVKAKVLPEISQEV